MSQSNSPQKWLWIGFSAALLSALMTSLAIISHFHRGAHGSFLKHISNRNELLFTMLYAITLMVVPFALWHRLDDYKRK